MNWLKALSIVSLVVDIWKKVRPVKVTEADMLPSGNAVDTDIIGGAEAPREEGRMHITIDRFADTPMGTFGRLVAGDFACYTVELPWEGNAPHVSCIPTGTYPLRLRPSPIVQRTSGHEQGWEVCDVPGRKLIMLHVANTMDDLEGCIGVGKGLGFVAGKWAVTNSKTAFSELMRTLPPGEHAITIR